MCATYQVIGDDVSEDEETFSIRFEVQNGNDMISGATSVSITILDDQDRE